MFLYPLSVLFVSYHLHELNTEYIMMLTHKLLPEHRIAVPFKITSNYYCRIFEHSLNFHSSYPF
jgi:hypothetical protein